MKFVIHNADAGYLRIRTDDNAGPSRALGGYWTRAIAEATVFAVEDAISLARAGWGSVETEHGGGPPAEVAKEAPRGTVFGCAHSEVEANWPRRAPR